MDETSALATGTESVESLAGRPEIEPISGTTWTHRQAEAEKRAALRVYLGAAPGVGKTYAMLSEGQRRLERGGDVVVGIVETYDRPKTIEIARGLDIVPARAVEYRASRSRRWTPRV